MPQPAYPYTNPSRSPAGAGIGAGDVIRDLGALNGAIAEEVARARQAGRAVLMTGGNCCHITGILGGLQDAHGPGVRAGLVWFDAHGDFNTPQTTLSGMLGGMPVAVCAGLAYPVWREGSHIVAPLPTDRVVMVDVRNLDAAEEQLIRAVGIPIVPVSPALPGGALHQAVTELAARVDMLYLHIDADILDERYVPDNRTREPDGPDIEQVLAAVDAVMATGKVAVWRWCPWTRGLPHAVAFRHRAHPQRAGVLAASRHGGISESIRGLATTLALQSDTSTHTRR